LTAADEARIGSLSDLVASGAAARRHDLTDARSAMLTPALPAASVKGRPPRWIKQQIIDS
jgi:hypothetical protein